MTILLILLIIVLFCCAVANQDHAYHNAVRRGFGLKEETFVERMKRRLQ